jgi:hypothetical protein
MIVSNPYVPPNRFRPKGFDMIAVINANLDRVESAWSIGQSALPILGDDRPDMPADGRPLPDQPRVSLVMDLAIRGLGLLGIGLSAGACLWLHRLLHAATPPAPTLGQYALATITFLAASIGAGLLILGGDIHDRVEIAERYRRRW